MPIASAGILVTLTAATTPYCLYDLIKAIDPKVAPTCGRLAIISDAANTPNTVLVGDALVSPTRYGRKLQANDVGLYGDMQTNNIYLQNKFVYGSIAGLKLGLEIDSV